MRQIVEQYNKVAESFTQDEWDDDFMFPQMEVAPNNTIRFSWEVFEGVEYGCVKRHKYITPTYAQKELEELQKK